MKRENTFCPPTDAYELLRCEAAPAILQTCYHRPSSRSHYASYGIEYTVRWEVYAVTPLLELEHVTYAYHSKNGEVCALSDISFQIQKAEFVAVVGPLRLRKIYTAVFNCRAAHTGERLCFITQHRGRRSVLHKGTQKDADGDPQGYRLYAAKGSLI